MENLEVAQRILNLLGRPYELIRFVTDRPGHDRRYAMNCDKLKSELGWRLPWTFEAGLADTIRWYSENQSWLEKVRSGAYREYFARDYGDRERLCRLLEATTCPTAVRLDFSEKTIRPIPLIPTVPPAELSPPFCATTSGRKALWNLLTRLASSAMPEPSFLV